MHQSDNSRSIQNNLYFNKPSTPSSRSLRKNHFQRKNSQKSQRTSSSRSESTSLSKFFVKNIQKRINDPEDATRVMFDKVIISDYDQSNRKQYLAQEPIKKNQIPTNMVPKTLIIKHHLYKNQQVKQVNKQKISDSLIEQQNQSYKQLYQKQLKQFKESAREIVAIKLKYKNLQQNNNKLTRINDQLEKKIFRLQNQMNSFSLNRTTSTEQNESQIYITPSINPLHKIKYNGFITVSKNSKFQKQHQESLKKLQMEIKNLKEINQMLLNKKCEQCSKNEKKILEQQLKFAQKQIFQYKQEIKKLNLQIDCAKRKGYNDLQNQKINKAIEYTNLKKRFTQLLNDYTQLKKTIKKQEISKKVKSAINQKKNVLSMISSNSSQEYNTILEISMSSQEF